MEEYIVDEVSARTAGELVRKYHYSGKVVGNSRLHLGIHCPEGKIRGIWKGHLNSVVTLRLSNDSLFRRSKSCYLLR